MDGREQRKRQSAQSSTFSLAGVDPEAVGDKDSLVPGKWKTLGSLSVHALVTHIASVCEPMALSNSNIRSKINHGGLGTSNKLHILRIIELMTGLQDDFEITEKLRYWSAFEEYVAALNNGRNRMGRDLALPANFETSGVYCAFIREDVIWLAHRGFGFDKPLRFGPAGKFKEEDLRIEYNWSEQRAVLNIAGSGTPPSRLSTTFCAMVQQRDAHMLAALAQFQGNTQLQLRDARPPLALKAPLDVQASPAPQQQQAATTGGHDESHVTPSTKRQKMETPPPEPVEPGIADAVAAAASSESGVCFGESSAVHAVAAAVATETTENDMAAEDEEEDYDDSMPLAE